MCPSCITYWNRKAQTSIKIPGPDLLPWQTPWNGSYLVSLYLCVESPCPVMGEKIISWITRRRVLIAGRCITQNCGDMYQKNSISYLSIGTRQRSLVHLGNEYALAYPRRASCMLLLLPISVPSGYQAPPPEIICDQTGVVYSTTIQPLQICNVFYTVTVCLLFHWFYETNAISYSLLKC